MSEARGMALDDLARHILPTMLGSMSKREKEETKKAKPKKARRKPVKAPESLEVESEEIIEPKTSPRQETASVSIFELIGESPSEKKFKEDNKPQPKKRRIATKRPVRRKAK